MLFNSLIFWVFLPLFAVAHFATKGRARLAVSLAGSYLFYGWWDWRLLGLIGLQTGLSWYCGLRQADASSPAVARRWAGVSVVSALLILGTFKYAGFFAESFAALLASLGLAASAPVLQIILPVGISFYTFQGLSYNIDLARGHVPVERSLLRYAVYIAFFPQLVAGPIVRASDFLPQLHEDRAARWDDFVAGSLMVLSGLLLKVVLADSLAPIVEYRFERVEAFGGLSHLFGVVCYSFQIYGDFAGYSCIAIGVARILGYRFPVNFDFPYAACGLRDFWRRWHISLSSWLRDYLYVPLGGNRGGRWRTHRNLMLTMVLGGLWHGAAWTFVAWGLLHGFYLVAERALERYGFQDALPRWLARASGVVVTFALVNLAWVFFRADSFGDAWMILGKIATMEGGFHPGQIEQKFLAVKGAFLIVAFVVGEWIQRRWFPVDRVVSMPGVCVTFAALALLAIALLGSFREQAFIYFQF